MALETLIKHWFDGVRDVVLKTYFGTILTLNDVRYIPGLKRRLISVGQLDEKGYHVGFGDQQWKDTKGSLVVARGNKRRSLYMVEVHPLGIGAIIDGSGSAALWFGKAEEAFFHNLIEDKETAEVGASLYRRYNANLQVKCLKFNNETPLEFGVAERLSQTFRAESMRLRAEAPHILWADSVKNLAKNDCIVAEHGLSSEITQSPGGSSDTSEGSENSGNFKDSGRSDEEYSKDGASSKEGGSETLQLKKSIIAARRYKAGLVVKGFQQKRGVDYNEIFSPVMKMTTIKLVFSIVAAGAFLCGSLE
ncbi:retrovirus-related pol polyprotein from transposon TNT 1-94 [Tanacetum coccineum]